MPKFNDLDLDNWKDCDIWTDSLWIIDGRDKSGKHSNFYHGNFVPQIPKQLILRYTKKGDIVLDPFMGSGTTAFEAEQHERKFIGIDIRRDLVEDVKRKIAKNKSDFSFFNGDSCSEDVKNYLKATLGQRKIQLSILHPPYFDIIKFSNLKGDLSNAGTLKNFIDRFSLAVKNILEFQSTGSYIAVVIGDNYRSGEWIPLGFYCMQEGMKLGLKLKSVIVKNMSGNRAKIQKEGIWRYRALTSDYYIFKHEYIFLFKNGGY